MYMCIYEIDMVDEEHPLPPYKMVLVAMSALLYCSLVISLNCSFSFFV